MIWLVVRAASVWFHRNCIPVLPLESVFQNVLFSQLFGIPLRSLEGIVSLNVSALLVEIGFKGNSLKHACRTLLLAVDGGFKSQFYLLLR